MTEDLQKIDAAPEAKPHKVPLNAKEELNDFFRTAMIAVALALLIRSILFEPFNIPSGSMKPTLDVGDYLFVNKYVYGYSRFSFPFGIAPIAGRIWEAPPQRGDIVVFKRSPDLYGDPYIKRLIGLPGDKIQVRNGRLYINGTLVPREPLGIRKDTEGGESVTMVEYLETLPNGVIHSIYEEGDDEILDNTGVYEVPEDHYFMMGDNRDNSQDSRVASAVGFVPFENFVGKADFIFFSTNGYARIYEFWKWPWTIRYERFFQSIRPVGGIKETPDVPAKP